MDCFNLHVHLVFQQVVHVVNVGMFEVWFDGFVRVAVDSIGHDLNLHTPSVGMVEIIGYLSLISSYSMSVTKISHTFPRARLIISSGDPSNFSSPRFNKASFLQVLEISPTIWVERMMMESLSLMSDRMLRNRILSSGSSPVVGSSTIITFGFPIMAWAIRVFVSYPRITGWPNGHGLQTNQLYVASRLPLRPGVVSP